MRRNIKQLRVLLISPVVVLIIGTLGFMLLEKLSFLDALYFTVVTITTVGFGDISPATAAGKGFSIFIIIVGISSFLTILTNLTQWLVERSQAKLHRHRINMLIGVFFTEVGNDLLRLFVKADPYVSTVREGLLMTTEWTAPEFVELKRHLSGYHYNVDHGLLPLEPLRDFLQKKGETLVHQLENESLIENEQFSNLLWAVVHLRDELAARPGFTDLPESDIEHLGVDCTRAYTHLTRQWIDYMHFLKNRYPFLFSLALRTNPFVEGASAIVK